MIKLGPCHKLTRAQSNRVFLQVLHDSDVPALRRLCQEDLFFLLTVAFQRKDLNVRGAGCCPDWLYERVREVEASPDGHLDLWAREHYKDLACDTPVRTPHKGWVAHGDLVPGDYVFSPEGTPARVVAVTQHFLDSECFRIEFNDGETLVAGGGHLWEIRKKHRRRVGLKRKIEFSTEIKTTKELCTSSGRIDVGVSVPYKGHNVRMVVDPYVLGIWLGDGHSSCGRVTSADKEVFSEIEKRGYKLSSLNGITRNIYGLRPLLRDIGVLDNKRIPDQYFYAGTDVRLDLLRGLMDSDGHCNTRGTATFVNQNVELASQVYELAASVGMRPRIRKYVPKDNPTFWQVSFQAKKDSNPFLLERKARRAIEKSYYEGSRLVKHIERVASVPTNCIQVEGGKYAVGRGFVPTKNSTIITYGHTIKDILNDPEVTVGIFSHTRPIAKAFLSQIKTEFETNRFLQQLFPEILWSDPKRQAPVWSRDSGIVVKRKSNPKEQTIEAYGLVDGQPTSKHFKILVYDDVVTKESVSNPDQIKNTTDSLSLSYNLGADGGVMRFIGTRYHENDTYKEIMRRGSVLRRFYPATKSGKDSSTFADSVFLSPESLRTKRRDMGPYIFAAQMLQNPTADKAMGFKEEWIKYWYPTVKAADKNWNYYLLCDPAGEKKKLRNLDPDYTVQVVLAVGPDRNYYLVEGYRARWNLTERTANLIKLHRRYQPLGVGYEKYGKDSDIEHVKYEQELQQYRFEIIPLGGAMAKEDRIRGLVPLFEQGRFFLPNRFLYKNEEDVVKDFVQDFINDEYLDFPVSTHDDMLDCCARILNPELKVQFPKPKEHRQQFNQPMVANNKYQMFGR